MSRLRLPAARLLLWSLPLVVLAIGAATVAWRRAMGPEVAVARVQARPLVQTLVFSARVASPTRVFLGSTLTGRVAAVPQREGARLAGGDTVVQLEEAELAATVRQAQAALASAEARLDSQQGLLAPVARQQLEPARAHAGVAERERERAEALFAQGFIGQSRVDEARRAAEVARAQRESADVQARANASGGELAQARSRVDEARAALELALARLAQARVRAPADALLLSRLVEPGQIVQPGTRLAEIALSAAPQLVAQVDEKYLGRLQPGMAASVVADAYPGQPFEARIASVAPLVDALRGSVEIKLSLGAAPQFLRNDMTVSVEVVAARRERALVVPGEALRPGPAVLLLAEGRTALRAVTVGLRTLDSAEVTGGLQAGDQVVLDSAIGDGVRARPGSRPAVGGNAGAAEAADSALRSMAR